MVYISKLVNLGRNWFGDRKKKKSLPSSYHKSVALNTIKKLKYTSSNFFFFLIPKKLFLVKSHMVTYDIV